MTTPVRWTLLWGPVVAYMAGIFYLSAQSNPPVPGPIPDWVLHGVEYCGLGIVVFRAVAGGLGAPLTASSVTTTLLITLTYAISDEVHQMFVPYRTADIRDVLADAAGASLALVACWACHIIATLSRRASTPDARH